MIKFSTKCRYGLRALATIARSPEDVPVKGREIARQQHFSESYLENICMILKSKGFIATVRGAHGGYMLARSASQIVIRDVVEALEGPISLVDCLDDCKRCTHEDDCVTRAMWKTLRHAIVGILDKMTLEDLLQFSDTKSERILKNALYSWICEDGEKPV